MKENVSGCFFSEHSVVRLVGCGLNCDDERLKAQQHASRFVYRLVS